MNVFCRLAKTIFVMGLTLGALVACGGGGGGGGNGSSGYTGVQTQAVINDDNAQQLALDAYNGGAMADPMTDQVFTMAAGSGNDQPLAPLGRILFDSLPELDFTPTVAPMATEVINGTCGGTATVSASEGETSASGSIVYNDYCEDGMVLNGSVSFAGKLNQQTNVVSMTMTFGTLTTEEGSLSGSITMIFTLYDENAVMTMSMNMVLTDALDRTYWVDHYTLVVTPGTTYDTAQFTGTYHDFEAGHMVITTTDSLLIDSVTGIPESGTLHFAGAEGTWADLTATGSGGYTLTVSTGTVITGTF